MEPVLLSLTIVSLTTSAILGVLIWKLRREEQLRSAARVALLSAAIDPERATTRGAAMFTGVRSIPAEGHGLIKAGIGMTMAIVVAGAWMANRGPSTTTEAPRGQEATTAAATAAALSHAAAPIELVSMRDTREGETLTVAGLVRNPRGGAEVRRVTAVVLGFDRQGALVTSGRGALDFVTLQPGDESAFVVSLPRASGIDRYRVSFRTDEGTVRHVDRRTAERPTAPSHLP